MVYSFAGGNDGATPQAGLINVKGTLYGTTSDGGANYTGTVFAIAPSGAETVLHSFGGGGDGFYPTAGLIKVKGTLYGTTELGGANGYGTVFAIPSFGPEITLYSFVGYPYDGFYPAASLINVNGTLYGTTTGGGANNYGTVFSITPSGTETVLHSFAGYPYDGTDPLASLIKVKGTLYGTMSAGGANCSSKCGTVFAITPSGAETVLHSFGSGSDGADPEACLIKIKGTLYGTTWSGGANGHGTVFAIPRFGSPTVLHSFVGSPYDGTHPEAGLTNVNGTLYGTTSGGGANCGSSGGCGTVFSITP